LLLSAGRIYMTSDGVLVLRTVSRSLVSKEVENITEDYLSLEDNGQVVVDRMCCMHVASGKRAVQYQVGEWGGGARHDSVAWCCAACVWECFS
jgi:hypothetical protein